MSAYDKADKPLNVMPDVWRTMKGSVWMMRARDIPNKDSYLYASGVCVTSQGYILTARSSILDSDSLEGRAFGDKKCRPLKFVYVNLKWGWAVVAPKEVLPGETFVSSALFNGPSIQGSSVMILGNPGTINFSFQKGIVTHDCIFNPSQLDSKRACSSHKSYLSVQDVYSSLDERIKLDKHLSLSLEVPLLSVLHVEYVKGLSGCPIFDCEGVVRGLIWFTDTTLVFGIPSQSIIYCIRINEEKNKGKSGRKNRVFLGKHHLQNCLLGLRNKRRKLKKNEKKKNPLQCNHLMLLMQLLEDRVDEFPDSIELRVVTIDRFQGHIADSLIISWKTFHMTLCNHPLPTTINDELVHGSVKFPKEGNLRWRQSIMKMAAPPVKSHPPSIPVS
ncbi:hypothetical protein LIER_24747 [Lithospermum erythrorhizon]|uniref:Uncharacterized protein n=1 Tax=Lithospermum erythrorhizon TaxID=34254 RepID=A0AAV3R5C0_LITER